MDAALGSNNKLHCCLVVLIVFILIFLSLPLVFINNGIYNFVIKFKNYEEQVQAISSVSPQSVPDSFDCLQYSQANELMLVDEDAKCPDSFFACKLICRNICIEQIKQCNNITDCPDRSDEIECLDTNGALKHVFKNVFDDGHNIESNTRYNNNNKLGLSCKSTNSSYALPESGCSRAELEEDKCPCNLSDNSVVICIEMNLLNIPSTISPSVYKIRMSNNSIQEIDNVVWPSSLTTLVLDNNRIKKIGFAAFKGAKNLVKIYLQHNDLASIDRDAFWGLECLHTLQLEGNNLTTFDSNSVIHTPLMKKIDLSKNLINLPMHTNFSVCHNLEELHLDHNRITIIRAHWFSNLQSLTWLALHHNEIEFIEDGAFDRDYSLAELDLSFNKIKYLNSHTLVSRGQLTLERLKLESNPIKQLPPDAFVRVLDLRSLDLTDIEFTELNRETYAVLKKLDFIYFSKFHYCHYAYHVRVCRPSTDGVSTGKELLGFPTLKYAVWIVAFVCSVSNVFVFVWRSISPHEDRTMSLFVKNLSIADLMMGIYLTSIAYLDTKFARKFGPNAIEWMSSPTCTAIGFLAILSSELSVFILTIITIERYRSITSISRFDEQKQKNRAMIYVLSAWLLAIIIAIYPLLTWFSGDSINYATNGLCLPLHIDQPYTPGWKYSAFVYLIVNSSAVILIIILYVHMYLMIMDGRKVSKPALMKDAEKREDAILAIRFFFIVLTGCLCLIPIVVIKVMALAKVSIPSSIYGWLVVFIIPINSALNPLVYTLAAPTSLRDAVCRKIGHFCYKIDIVTSTWWIFNVMHNKKTNKSHRSSSTGSTTIESTSSLTSQRG